MAVKSDIETDLTLEIDGPDVTPEKFLRSVRSFFSILTEVTTKVAGKKNAIQWKVKVKEGSNLVGVQSSPGFAPAVVSQIITAVSSGLAQLEERAAQPEYFSDRAIKSLRELAEVVDSGPDQKISIRVWAKKVPIKVTHKSVANIADIIAGELEDYGSIEGLLRAVTDKGGLHFVVHEPLWNHPVRCYIPERLTETALANFRKRVEVYGTIRYRKDGKAVSIHVDDMVPFPPADSLPSFLDVHGILREAS